MSIKNKMGVLAILVFVATVVGLLLRPAGDFDSHTGGNVNSVLSQQLQASNVQAPIDTAAMPMVSPMNSDMAGRDAKRISDLQQVQNYLKLYFDKCGHYPGQAEAGATCTGVGGGITA